MSSKHPPRLSHPPTGPHAVEDLGHAQNPAWWTVMGLGILAGIVGTWAVLALSMVLAIITVVIIVATIVAGVVLSKMGLGNYTYQRGDTASDSPSLGIK